MSWAQKGFLPFEGCAEHNFILQEVLQSARDARGNVSVAWLDLENAFGSVPHESLFGCLRDAGLEDELALLQDMYTNAGTLLPGVLDPVLFLAGVKQGDPISAILFVIVIEPLLRVLPLSRSAAWSCQAWTCL